MPDLKKMLTLEALSEALPSWLKRSTKPEYNADEIDSTLTTNQFVTASDKDNWNAKGTYSKPSGGIPKSDLSSIVQTSLEKADSALQSETDPTVPSWAKQSSKPSYTQDEVSDGSTYKRVTQTEKNAWSGKQNALTTTQMNAVNSGITSEKVTQIDSSLIQIVNDGAKNQLQLTGDVYNPNTLKVYWDYTNGTVRVVGTSATTATVVIYLGTWICPKDGNYKLWANAVARTDNIRVYDDATWSSYEFSGSSSVKTWTAGTERSLYLRIASNVVVGDITVTPMITTEPQFNISPDYEPHALGNQYLTPALIQQVDEGAKNVWDFANAAYGQSSHESHTKTDTSITVTSTGDWGYVSYGLPLKVGSYILSLKISNYTAASGTNPYVRVAVSKNGDYARAGSDIGDNGTYTIKFTAETEGTYWVIFGSNWSGTSGVAGYTASDLMVCTPADYGVSKKWVKYRPNWDSVGVTVTSLWKDSFSTVSAYSNNVTNIEGGYSLIGKLVVVNIRCTLSPDVNSWIILITGLPKPSVQYNTGNGAVCLAINKGDSAILTGQGAIGVTGNISSGETLLISGTYIAY